jgi:GNAT superfamily N-acetyltransferase
LHEQLDGIGTMMVESNRFWIPLKYAGRHTFRPSERGKMPILARPCDLHEISSLREEYREEMKCQIIHDSIHQRPGWTNEYALEIGGVTVGYGSVAVSGPWTTAHSLYEFYVRPPDRLNIFDLFDALRAKCNATKIETQTNDPLLTVMLHTFTQNLYAEAILFEDRFETQLKPESASMRCREAADVEQLKALDLDDGAAYVLIWNGSIAGAGGILYHYNRPYGDIYMKIAEPFQRKGLGAYLVQELKRVCRSGDSVPAVRCNALNTASRRTLQKAGFVPCGNLVSGELADFTAPD